MNGHCIAPSFPFSLFLSFPSFFLPFFLSFLPLSLSLQYCLSRGLRPAVGEYERERERENEGDELLLSLSLSLSLSFTHSTGLGLGHLQWNNSLPKGGCQLYAGYSK